MDDKREDTITSEWAASSIGVNAVVVRSVTGLLRRGGIVRTRQGAPGARLTRPLDQITLLDVYRAVETERELFTIHNRPNPKCPVGARIQSTLERFFGAVQGAMERELSDTTLAQIVGDMRLDDDSRSTHDQPDGPEH
jgi:DNA-binding IscR family transcriptional regulator